MKNAVIEPYFRGGRTSRKHTPLGFSRAPITTEMRETISKISVETFTVMVNNGHSFEAALSAVYTTGFENAFSAMKDQTNLANTQKGE